LADLQLQVTRPIFETWLKGTRGISLDNEKITVEAASPFVVEALERRLFTIIESGLLRASGKELNIAFVVKKIEAERRPFQKYKTTSPSFDSFVVGPSNKVAYTTTKIIANEPPDQPNLYLYSGPGLGKTHLMQAICEGVEEKRKTPVYVSAEEFTHDFVTSVQRGAESPMAFRQKYRSPDVLLIDDIQFFLGKKRTLEVFLSTISSRLQKKRSVVLAGDRPPSHFAALDTRLTSVLSGGLAVNISPPEKETINTIFQKTCQELNLKLSHTIERYIKDSFHGNIRALLGFLNTLLVFQKSQNTPVSLPVIKHLLGEIVGASKNTNIQTLNPEEILTKTAESFGVSLSKLQGSSRDRQTSEARHAAMYLLRKKTSLTLREIGLLLGGRDHASVASAINKFKSNPISDKFLL
jgi:chromosomal replication initiator protein